MARTGLKQPTILSSITCGQSRTGEATQWGYTRDALESYVNNGLTLCSGSGSLLADSVHPVVGAYVNTSGSFVGNTGTMILEHPFEQPSLVTTGTSTSGDKYILSIRYGLMNWLGASYSYTSGGGGTGTTHIGGRITATLSNSGGSSPLYQARSSIVAASGLDTEVKTVSGEFQEFEAVVTGTIPSGLVPPPGTTYDSRLRLQVSALAVADAPAIPSDTIFFCTNPGEKTYYVGILSYTFRIYNEG